MKELIKKYALEIMLVTILSISLSGIVIMFKDWRPVKSEAPAPMTSTSAEESFCDSAEKRVCQPGDGHVCHCLSGIEGVQWCSEDCASWTACECPENYQPRPAFLSPTYKIARLGERCSCDEDGQELSVLEGVGFCIDGAIVTKEAYEKVSKDPGFVHEICPDPRKNINK